jgi:hypothetical protein
MLSSSNGGAPHSGGISSRINERWLPPVFAWTQRGVVPVFAALLLPGVRRAMATRNVEYADGLLTLVTATCLKVVR